MQTGSDSLQHWNKIFSADVFEYNFFFRLRYIKLAVENVISQSTFGNLVDGCFKLRHNGQI